MAQIKKEVKLFIVRSLAVFNTPSETAEAVYQEFKVVVTKQNCEKYDPTKRAGQNLSAELKAEFEATRKQFLDNPQHIPIANLTYRLQRLQRIVDQGGKNHMLVMAALEQAAKEKGGMYINTRIEKEVPKDESPRPDYTLKLNPDGDIPSDPIL